MLVSLAMRSLKLGSCNVPLNKIGASHSWVRLIILMHNTGATGVNQKLNAAVMVDKQSTTIADFNSQFGQFLSSLFELVCRCLTAWHVLLIGLSIMMNLLTFCCTVVNAARNNALSSPLLVNHRKLACTMKVLHSMNQTLEVLSVTPKKPSWQLQST